MGRVGRPTKDGALALVDGLLDHAGQAFVSFGYRATTIEAVARLAGASKKTIYAQFGDKAGLFRAVCEKVAAERGKLLPLGDPGAGRDGLVKRAEAIVEGAFETHALAFNRLLMREGADFPELQRIALEISEAHVTLPLTGYFAREFPHAGRDRLLFLSDAFIDLLLGRYMGLVSQANIAELRAWYTARKIADICDLFLAGSTAFGGGRAVDH